MVHTCESAIKVVTGNKPKRLSGLSQKAMEGGIPSLTCGIVDHTPPGRPQAPNPTHARSGTWKPRTSPSGNARRQVSREVCGSRRSEEAKATLEWGGEGYDTPPRKCADVRLVARRETDLARRHVEAMDWSNVRSGTGTLPHGSFDWHASNWRKVLRSVRRLHMRIAEAMRQGRRGTVHA